MMKENENDQSESICSHSPENVRLRIYYRFQIVEKGLEITTSKLNQWNISREALKIRRKKFRKEAEMLVATAYQPISADRSS